MGRRVNMKRIIGFLLLMATLTWVPSFVFTDTTAECKVTETESLLNIDCTTADGQAIYVGQFDNTVSSTTVDAAIVAKLKTSVKPSTTVAAVKAAIHGKVYIVKTQPQQEKP